MRITALPATFPMRRPRAFAASGLFGANAPGKPAPSVDVQRGLDGGDVVWADLYVRSVRKH